MKVEAMVDLVCVPRKHLARFWSSVVSCNFGPLDFNHQLLTHPFPVNDFLLLVKVLDTA